jgi:hypothetical protein
MGSLPEGTLCAYCGEHEAGYIPDGCIGPVCFGDLDDPDEGFEGCFELSLRLGWETVMEKYCHRVFTAMIKMISRGGDELISRGGDELTRGGDELISRGGDEFEPDLLRALPASAQVVIARFLFNA